MSQLLDGLQRELLRPDTIRYIAAALTDAINRLVDERPRVEAEVRAARGRAAQRLQRLIGASESGDSPIDADRRVLQRATG